MESGPSLLRRATRRSRVSSPSAAKTGAASVAGATAPSGRLGEVALDGHHLLGPAAFVAAVGGIAVLRGHGIEPGLAHGEQRAAVDVLEAELDEGGRRGHETRFRFDEDVPPPGPKTFR